MPVTDAIKLWTTCASSIRAQVSDAVWQTTFVGAHTLQIDNGTLVIAVPSLLVKERIEGRYLWMVRDAMADAGAPELDLRLLVDTPTPVEDD